MQGFLFKEDLMSQRSEINKIAFISIMIAFAAVIEVAMMFIPSLPQGGSISLSLFPLFIIAYKEGPITGLFGSLIFGLVNFMLSGFQLYGVWQSFFLDYLLAFGLVGLSGFVFSINKESRPLFIGGIFVGSFLRFLMHYLSGVILFGEFAPEGTPAALYSLIYNGSYMLPSFILLAVVGFFSFKRIQTL
jgi:thiamine transporter